MAHARTFVVVLVFVVAASCMPRADVTGTVAVATVDERATPAPPITQTYARDDFNNVQRSSTEVATFTVAVTARVKASSAMLHTVFTSREPSPAPSPGAVVTLDDATPIVAALLKAGVSRDAITLRQVMLAPNHQGAIPGGVDIDVALKNTDPQYIRSLGQAIDDAKGYPSFHAFSDVTFSIGDCSALLTKARSAALARARVEATRAVPGPHPRLGPVVDVRELGLAVTEGACGGVGAAGGPVSVYRNGQFEIANGGTVAATSRLTVGFQLLP